MRQRGVAELRRRAPKFLSLESFSMPTAKSMEFPSEATKVKDHDWL